MKNLSTNTAEFSSIKAGDGNGLHLQDDGGNGLFIKDGGNIGVGTTNPGSKLDIFTESDNTGSAYGNLADSLLLKNKSNIVGAGPKMIFYSLPDTGGSGSPSAIIGLQRHTTNTNEGNLVFFTRGALNPEERMRINSSGNVGIGTTNPVYKFHVADTSTANLLIQRRTPGGQVDGITLNSIGGTGINNRTGDIALIMTSAAGDAQPALRFSTTNGASPTEHAMHITNGKVGIGTTNPSALFELQKASAGKIAVLNTTSGGGFIQLEVGAATHGYYQWGMTTAAATGGDNILISNATAGGGVAIQTDGNNNRMYIDNVGNVGIGTTNPDYGLHVVDQRNGSFAAEIRNTSTGTTGAAGPHGLHIKYSAASPDQTHMDFLRCSDTTATRMRVYSDGDVWTSDSGFLTSDERLKNNIQDATPKLEDIKKLKVRNFEWNSEFHPGKTGEKKIGFIAQEMEEVFPGLVNDHDISVNDETINRKSIRMGALIPILTKAIQEQQQIIEDLKSQNESLVARIEALEG